MKQLWFSILPNNGQSVCSQMPEWCLRFGIVRLSKKSPSFDVDDPAACLAYTKIILEVGKTGGLDRVGVAPAQVMHRAHQTLVQRKAAGLHDTMQFTYRNPARSTDPQSAVRDAKSMIVGAYSYASPLPDPQSHPSARVARYAWTEYYESLKVGLFAMRDVLRADGFKAVVFADDNSMVDREAAYLAGLGWFGKNANVLIEGAGSFFVLGSVITTAPLTINDVIAADGCGSCRRCIDACPTQAIIEPGTVDAAKCLAWLIQKPGVFDRRYREALGDRIYGCDDCQEVCPPTTRLSLSKPLRNDARPWVNVLELLDMDDEALLTHVQQWYIADRNPDWVRRNALIVLGNIGERTDAHVVDVLARYLEHSDPMLRAHAVWSASRLGLVDLLPIHDTAPLVIDELRNLPLARQSEI
ncbi:MAG: tRNA epoxyqueuosine(34) reductase QueG [Actinobacteria bacterium]|nr:MAG: tRNA epoxyqueuosine(34) reductase QueG [Actinomycetota bacterium]